jgi:signal transduction histidine kinase
VGILAGGIAHDFNNLLAIIQGYIELSRSSIPPEDRVQNYLIAAERATMQTAELTKRLITFSKGGEPFMKPCDISELVKDVVQRIAVTKPVEKKYFIHGDILPVTIDMSQMRQVIRNLVSNALEAMPEGGTLTLVIENIMVHRQDHLPISEGMYVRVSLEDTGVGIAENNLPHIFDPYYSTKERGSQKGMGLGLAVCYNVVSRHNGYIKAESKKGRGTVFYIYLPAAHELPPLKREIGAEKHEKSKGSQSIRIKDDTKVQ